MEAKTHVRDAEVKIQIEYIEMPQMTLTARQMQRLWSLPADVCEAALSGLLRKGFLAQVTDGVYVRCRQRRAGTEPLVGLIHAS